MSAPLLLRVGLLATVRNRRGIISAVIPYQHANATGVYHLVRVDYSDFDGPQEDQFIWELEPNAKVIQSQQSPYPEQQTRQEAIRVSPQLVTNLSNSRFCQELW